MTTILIIVNVFSALAIIVLALMQQSKGDMGSAFGGGGSQSMFGSRGSANFLSRSTALMCVVFFVSSLALAYVYAKRAESTSVINAPSVIEQGAEMVESDEVVEPEVPTIDRGIPSLPNSPEGIVENEADQTTNTAEQEIPAVPEE